MERVEIRVKGQIDEHWSDWFDDLTIRHADDETVLTGTVADQAMLYGLLAKLRDLGLPLVSVQNSEVTDHGDQCLSRAEPGEREDWIPDSSSRCAQGFTEGGSR